MKKKIFVSKDSRSGFRSYLKFLLWAAVGLVVLVLFIPLTSRQKSGKEAVKKPSSERGVVVKEIPKSLQPIAESISRGQGGAGEPSKVADSKPASPPEGKSAADLSGSQPPAPIKEKPVADTPPGTQKVETASETVPKNLPGRPGSPELAAGQAAKEVQAVPKVGEPPTREAQTSPQKKPDPTTLAAIENKPKAAASAAPAPSKPVKPAAPAAATSAVNAQPSSGGRKMYAVQIASLKDKQSAEELKNTLQKKGFVVVIKTSGDPKQGQTYNLELQPVDNMSKASTLLEQVKYVPKVKPSIITIPGGN